MYSIAYTMDQALSYGLPKFRNPRAYSRCRIAYSFAYGGRNFSYRLLLLFGYQDLVQNRVSSRLLCTIYRPHGNPDYSYSFWELKQRETTPLSKQLLSFSRCLHYPLSSASFCSHSLSDSKYHVFI